MAEFPPSTDVRMLFRLHVGIVSSVGKSVDTNSHFQKGWQTKLFCAGKSIQNLASYFPHFHFHQPKVSNGSESFGSVESFSGSSVGGGSGGGGWFDDDVRDTLDRTEVSDKEFICTGGGVVVADVVVDMLLDKAEGIGWFINCICGIATCCCCCCGVNKLWPFEEKFGGPIPKLGRPDIPRLDMSFCCCSSALYWFCGNCEPNPPNDRSCCCCCNCCCCNCCCSSSRFLIPSASLYILLLLLLLLLSVKKVGCCCCNWSCCCCKSKGFGFKRGLLLGCCCGNDSGFRPLEIALGIPYPFWLEPKSVIFVNTDSGSYCCCCCCTLLPVVLLGRVLLLVVDCCCCCCNNTCWSVACNLRMISCCNFKLSDICSCNRSLIDFWCCRCCSVIEAASSSFCWSVVVTELDRLFGWLFAVECRLLLLLILDGCCRWRGEGISVASTDFFSFLSLLITVPSVLSFVDRLLLAVLLARDRAGMIIFAVIDSMVAFWSMESRRFCREESVEVVDLYELRESSCSCRCCDVTDPESTDDCDVMELPR